MVVERPVEVRAEPVSLFPGLAQREVARSDPMVTRGLTAAGWRGAKGLSETVAWRGVVGQRDVEADAESFSVGWGLRRGR